MNNKTRINIETGCPVYVEIKGEGEKLKSKVIGLEHENYLILKDPAGSKEARGELVTGTMVVVKYVYQGVAYGFQTTVLTKIYNPANLVFIGYPPLVAEQSLRAEKRYDCHLKCSLNAEGAEQEGRIVDISMGGCCCAISKAEDAEPNVIIVGSTVEIKLELPESGEPLSITGIVNNVTEDKKASRLGIAFESPSKEVKAELKTLLFDLFTI